MEQRAELDRPELMERAHELVTELYHAALKLPVVRPSSHIDDDEDDLDDQRWWAVRDELGLLLGDADHYRDVFDPTDSSARALDWSLSEDLADIYRDIKEGLDLAEKNGSRWPADVIWAWRFHWEHHWGRHALGALRVLYARVTDYYARRPAEPRAPEA